MALPTQDLTLTFGAFTINNTNREEYFLNEMDYNINYSRLEANISFDIIVRGTTDSEIISRSNAVEEAFRDRRDSLTLSINGNTYRNFSATNKEVDSTIEVLNDDKFTKYSRHYRVNIVAELSPPEGNRTLESSSLNISSNKHKTLRFTVTYYSDPPQSAKQVYEADIEDFSEDIQDDWAPGNDWWLVSEELDGDIELGNTITSTRTYKQVVKSASVSYGGFTVGGGFSSSYQLVNGWELRKERLMAQVSFVVRCTSDTTSGLNSICNDLENAFRKRQQDLILFFNGVVFEGFTPRGTTYLNSKASVTELDNDWFGNADPSADCPATRDFRVNIEIDIPPQDEALGRTEDTVSISENAEGILTVTISVQYNGTASTGATTLLSNDFDSYTSDIRNFLNILVWEQISSNTEEVPIENGGLTVTEIRKTATFRELHYSELSVLQTDPNIKDLNFSINESRKYPGDSWPEKYQNILSDTILLEELEALSPQADIIDIKPQRFTDFRIEISFGVLKARPDLLSYWEEVRDQVLNYMIQVYGINLLTVVDSTNSINRTTNRVSGTITAQAALGSIVLSSEFTAELSNADLGKLIIGAHDKTPFGNYELEKKALRFRTFNLTLTVVDNVDVNLPAPSIPPVGKKDGRWVSLSDNQRQTPKTFGDPQQIIKDNISILIYNLSERQQWVTNPKRQRLITS